MRFGRWSPQRIYEAARRVAPLLYLTLGWPDSLIIAVALALFALENSLLRRVHTPALFLHLAAVSLLPWQYGLIVAVLLTPFFHLAKKLDNVLDWRVHLPLLALASIARPQITPVFLYTIGEVVWYLAKFARDKPRVKPLGKLEAVAGRPFVYRLEIKTSAPALVKLPDGSTVTVNSISVVEARAKFDTAGVYTPPLEFTYVNATRTVRFQRVLKHPPIYVLPRYRRALELGEKLVVGLVEEVTGVREYQPGDSLRQLHWKKMLKIQKPVVKLLEGRRDEVMKVGALLYASTPKSLDRVLEALIAVVATTLTRSDAVEVFLVTRRGVDAVKVDRRNFKAAMEKAVSLGEALDSRVFLARDYAGLIPQLALQPLDVIIGERALVAPLCKPGTYCIYI